MSALQELLQNDHATGVWKTLEKERAEHERKRAEHLAAKLRELGFSDE